MKEFEDLLYNIDKRYFKQTFPKSGELLLRRSDYGVIQLEKIEQVVLKTDLDTVWDDNGNLIVVKSTF